MEIVFLHYVWEVILGHTLTYFIFKATIIIFLWILNAFINMIHYCNRIIDWYFVYCLILKFTSILPQCMLWLHISPFCDLLLLSIRRNMLFNLKRLYTGVVNTIILIILDWFNDLGRWTDIFPNQILMNHLLLYELLIGKFLINLVLGKSRNCRPSFV